MNANGRVGIDLLWVVSRLRRGRDSKKCGTRKSRWPPVQAYKRFGIFTIGAVRIRGASSRGPLLPLWECAWRSRNSSACVKGGQASHSRENVADRPARLHKRGGIRCGPPVRTTPVVICCQSVPQAIAPIHPTQPIDACDHVDADLNRQRGAGDWAVSELLENISTHAHGPVRRGHGWIPTFLEGPTSTDGQAQAWKHTDCGNGKARIIFRRHC